VLTEIGYRVASAEDGLSALREILNEAPELLLSDLNMPGNPPVSSCSREVRRRFPANPDDRHERARSAVTRRPSGVAADGFYQRAAAWSPYADDGDIAPGDAERAKGNALSAERAKA